MDIFVTIIVLLILSLLLLSPVIKKPARGYITVNPGNTLTMHSSIYVDDLNYSYTYIAGMTSLLISIILLIYGNSR